MRVARHQLVATRLARLAWGALWAASAAAWETTPAQVERYSRLTLRYETPHTKWARPYALGRVRVLYFAASKSQGMETHAREIVELMQRFDLEVDAVYWYAFYGEYWFGGVAGKRRIARLMKKPYDVYLFQDVSPGKLPGEPARTKELLAKAVSQGAGVVLLGVDDGGVLKGKRPVAAPPPFLAGVRVGEVSGVGRGRVVALPKRPKIPYKIGWQVDYEYWQEQLGRAVLWAASRVPEMTLNVSAAGSEIARGSLPARAVSISWKGADAGKTSCQVVLRRRDGAQTFLGTERSARGSGSASFRLPLLRAGEYHLDAIARNAKGVQAWATTAFKVTSPSAVKKLELDWLARRDGVQEWAKWHTPWAEPGQDLSGTVETTGKGGKLRVRLMDRLGRVLARADLPQGGPRAFKFRIEPWMPMLLRVEAVVLDGDDEVASDYRFFQVTRRRRGKFNFVLWDYPVGQTLAPYAAASLRRLGVTAILASKPPTLDVAAYGLAWAPWTGGQLRAARAERWNDEDATRYFEMSVGRSRPHGAFVYSLGDEGAVHGGGVGPKPMTAYRKYLGEVYGDVGALNRSWGAAFRSFDEVALAKPKDGAEAASLRAGNFPRWYDRQAFLRHNFVHFCKAHARAMRGIDPVAVVGFEGSGQFARSADPDLVCRELGFWVPYASSVDEIIRSVAPREFIRANWMGYHKSADGLLSKYWRMVTHGCDSVWWWMWSAMGAWQGFHAADLAAYPPTQEMLRDTRIVRDGLGDLLLHYDMLDDGIAMLYSLPSSFAATLESNPSYGSYETNHRAWFTVIHDLALQFRYVTDRGLDRGEPVAGRFKILILPQAVALSPRTAQLVRDFVRRGGTVLADVRPGAYDGHCRPLAKGMLDDLFGIRAVGRRKAKAGQAVIGGTVGEKKLALAWPKALADPGVALAGGQALGAAGDVPACIVNRVGRGRAILLNFAMSSFPARQVARGLTHQASWEETPADVGVFFRGLFAAAGVEPAINLVKYKNRPKRPFLGNVKVQRWKNGGVELVSLFRETGPWTMASVVLPNGPRHVYDLRHQVPVGKVGWWVAEILPSRATFFALLPKEVPPPKIAFAAGTVRRGTVALAEISVPGAAGLHALKLRAATPAGEPIDSWEQVVIVGGTPRSIPLPVAFNDPVGAYTVTVTDVFTPDTATTASFAVE